MADRNMPLSTGLSGQRVLVTAASQGIGFGVAKAFLGEGARVVINSSNAAKLESARTQLAGLGEVQGVAADLSSGTDIDTLVSKTVEILGGIDTLAYVTGSPMPGRVMDKSYEDWEAAAKLLTISPAYLGRKVAQVMIDQKVKGRLVFSASWVIKEPAPNLALSNVCRVAVLGLVRTLARELGPAGIRVNAILPGTILTGRTDQLAKDIAKRSGMSETQALNSMVSQIPLGYIGTTDELAKSFLFLGSDMSSYVSGAALPVDGASLHSIG
jgi:3-oxoacyl-[acyl-carrier protein] reductase